MIFTSPPLDSSKIHCLLTQICVLLLVKSSLYYPYTLGCVDFQRTMVHLPGPMPSEKTDFPCPGSYRN